MTVVYMIGSSVLCMYQSFRRVSQNERARTRAPYVYTRRKNGGNQIGSDADCRLMARQEL